jgi:hypothetical protein
MLPPASARLTVLGFSSVHPRRRTTSTAATPPPTSGADRHAEAAEHRPRPPAPHKLSQLSLGRRATWLTLAAAVLATTVLATPNNCYAEEDSTPSILGYALEGFGTGIAVGFATGYLATGPKFEGGEWRTLLWGGGIGALSGLGIGLILGIVDASTVPNGRGVGFYIMRDSNYGYTVGALAGGVIGALIWAGGGVSKDLLIGLAWGTVIGAGAGVIMGVIEGALRNGRGSKAERRTPFQVGLGCTPALEGGAPMAYPTLSGRF